MLPVQLVQQQHVLKPALGYTVDNAALAENHPPLMDMHGACLIDDPDTFSPLFAHHQMSLKSPQTVHDHVFSSQDHQDVVESVNNTTNRADQSDTHPHDHYRHNIDDLVARMPHSGAVVHLSAASEGSFRCPDYTCAKLFTQLSHLKVHYRTHTGEKPYVCSFLGCGKSFTQNGNLKMHERQHSGIKPHRCLSCGRRFAQLGNLKIHERTHSGSRPYVCIVNSCSRAFSQMGNLRTHQLKVHDIPRRTPFHEVALVATDNHNENYDLTSTPSQSMQQPSILLLSDIPSDEHTSEYSYHQQDTNSTVAQAAEGDPIDVTSNENVYTVSFPLASAPPRRRRSSHPIEPKMIPDMTNTFSSKKRKTPQKCQPVVQHIQREIKNDNELSLSLTNTYSSPSLTTSNSTISRMITTEAMSLQLPTTISRTIDNALSCSSPTSFTFESPCQLTTTGLRVPNYRDTNTSDFWSTNNGNSCNNSSIDFLLQQQLQQHQHQNSSNKNEVYHLVNNNDNRECRGGTSSDMVDPWTWYSQTDTTTANDIFGHQYPTSVPSSTPFSLLASDQQLQLQQQHFLVSRLQPRVVLVPDHRTVPSNTTNMADECSPRFAVRRSSSSHPGTFNNYTCTLPRTKRSMSVTGAAPPSRPIIPTTLVFSHQQQHQQQQTQACQYPHQQSMSTTTTPSKSNDGTSSMIAFMGHQRQQDILPQPIAMSIGVPPTPGMLNVSSYMPARATSINASSAASSPWQLVMPVSFSPANDSALWYYQQQQQPYSLLNEAFRDGPGHNDLSHSLTTQKLHHYHPTSEAHDLSALTPVTNGNSHSNQSTAISKASVINSSSKEATVSPDLFENKMAAPSKENQQRRQRQESAKAMVKAIDIRPTINSSMDTTDQSYRFQAHFPFQQRALFTASFDAPGPVSRSSNTAPSTPASTIPSSVLSKSQPAASLLLLMSCTPHTQQNHSSNVTATAPLMSQVDNANTVHVTSVTSDRPQQEPYPATRPQPVKTYVLVFSSLASALPLAMLI